MMPWSPTDACLNDCSVARCGDGCPDRVEACDDENGVDDDECNDCRRPNTGDSEIQRPRLPSIHEEHPELASGLFWVDPDGGDVAAGLLRQKR